MKCATALAIGTLVLLASCTDDRSAQSKLAASTFSRFQKALQLGNRELVRTMLTSESTPVLDGIDWAAVAKQPPLDVRGARFVDNEFWVEVHDPETPDSVSRFVLVRENGRMVVDLVASAAHHATLVPSNRPMVEPRELTPEDLERAANIQQTSPAAAPPR
ncbi:MAG: hypothetical protein RL148_2233 [Planctomycetota bacterium]